MDVADGKWQDFLNDIDGAIYVKVVKFNPDDPDSESIIGVLTWYGGHTVLFFNENLNEEVYNIGDFSKNEVPFEVAKKAIEEIANDIVQGRWDEYGDQ